MLLLASSGVWERGRESHIVNSRDKWFDGGVKLNKDDDNGSEEKEERTRRRKKVKSSSHFRKLEKMWENLRDHRALDVGGEEKYLHCDTKCWAASETLRLNTEVKHDFQPALRRG